MRRLFCWLTGHRYRVLAENPSRVAALAHLHTYAGTFAVCQRCGDVWNDLGPLAALWRKARRRAPAKQPQPLTE